MRIDGTRTVYIKPEMLEMLRNLEVGDTLKGRVLEALGSSIAIRTVGGQIFTALLQEGASIQKGAFVELVVSSLTDGKIYAEFKAETRDNSMDAKVSRQLMQLGLPVDEKNSEAAKLLIKYQLPVSKEAIINITSLQKSLESLNQSNEGRIALLLSGMDIKNTPVDILNKLVLGWSPDMIKPGDEAFDGTRAVNNPAAIVHEENVKETGGLPVKAKVIISPEIAEMDKEQAITVKSADKRLGEAIVDSDINDADKGGNIKIPEQNAGALKDSKAAELLKVMEKLGIEAGSEVKGIARQVTDILASIKNADMESITYLVSKEMDATPRNLGMLVRNTENTDGISQFLDKLQQSIKVEDNPELQEIKESVRKVFLEPRQVEEPDEVKEQLKDIVKLGEKLEHYLENSGKKDPEIREALSSLRDNIDFIRNINQQNNFMQIPIIINGNTSTAKLYVFKEGKRTKSINPENATVLVALDLQSLGHLESMIGVKSKTVNITFRVENSGIGALIEKYSNKLKASLNEKGYSLSPVRIINLEQSFSLISLEELLNGGSSGKIHFDTRI